MLSSYVTGLVAVVGVTLAWVAVQGLWRRAFPEAGSDPDVLAGRMGCHAASSPCCAGRDCDGGPCAVESCTVEDRAMEDRAVEEPQIEHDGRIGAAVEEIP